MAVVSIAREPVAGPASAWIATRSDLATCRASFPAAEARDWDPREREEVIAVLDTLISELTTYRGKVLLAHREDGRWGTALDRDFADWRARSTRGGRGAAVGELRLAEGLADLPELERAVESGEVGLEHARVLTGLRKDASPEVVRALEGDAGADLLNKARQLSAPELRKAASAAAARIDAEAAQRDFEAVHRRRSFTSRRHAGGRKGEFFLNDVDGTLLETALDAIVGTPAADDDRTREQRRADALVTLAGRVTQAGHDRNGAQIRPHLALVVTEETWTAVTTHRAAFDAALGSDPTPQTDYAGRSFFPTDDGGSDQDGCDHDGPVDGDADRLRRPGPERLSPLGALPPLPNVPAAELEDGSVVPLGELGRIMCDCETTRVVLDAESVPLDVGQTQRHYTRELRRAITTRDRHCQWPGCTIRASWCEVHHKHWYSHGGATSIDNGLTLCSYHHHRVHDHHVRITPVVGGHAFHDRHGQPIGTTRWLARTPPRRRTDDGLTPPLPTADPHGRATSTPPNDAGRALPAPPADTGRALPAPPADTGRALPAPPADTGRALPAPPADTGRALPARDPATTAGAADRRYAPALWEFGADPGQPAEPPF
ncbi:HNH endonuclease signature motif containing protein [Georgenia faecalis]|uniref:DUF222 domain-containing protein n=1 Tax=Georgenia faecalis TaxID=2483799 RepID=A0ABV9DA20_9MICO|nr:HNH endonuclease signature motif containing protein [Georgenia faecalis]